MKWGMALLAVLASVGAPSTGHAQSLSDGKAQDVHGTCELHVWPSQGFGSVYHGWFHGGIVNGAVTGRDGYPEVPPDPMRTEAQVGLLRDGLPSLQALIGHPDYRLIVHEEALPSRVVRSGAARIAADTAPCYAELIVDDLLFQQDFVNGGFLKTLFRYREFGPGEAPTRTFGSFVKTPLSQFPPQQPTAFPAAVEELNAAFRNNIALFGKALQAPAKKKRG